MSTNRLNRKNKRHGTINDIHANIKSTGATCFQNTTSIKSVTFEGIETIGDNCFQNASNLQTVNFCGSLQQLGVAAFTSCTSLTQINFPENGSLQTISQECFKDCTALEHISLPQNILQLDNKAFINCYRLNNVELDSNLTTIGQYCFANQTPGAKTSTASQLQYIYIPESTYNIYEGAFQNNQNLKEAIVGMLNAKDGIIQNYAFSNCPNLQSITFL